MRSLKRFESRLRNKERYIMVDTRDKGKALYNKSNLDVDKWATWLMLCYFGNFGGSNPPPPTSDVEITRTNIGGENVKKKYILADTRAVT